MRCRLPLLFVIALSFAGLIYGQKQSPQKLKEANVDFMLRGYFYAGSRIQDKNALGGFGSSENYPKTLGTNMNFPAGRVSLVAFPGEETIFGKEFKGMKVRLINTTGEPVSFSASDSRLYIIQEAIDRDGKWKPVEYLPSSWCGNSYHNIFLGTNEYWEFAAPRFNGVQKTRLRFRLQASNREKTAFIHSNEFEGGVNPKQFTVEQGHTPTGLMDPYNN
ncbi:MAG TPA: hypothetical protein VJ781_12685 [Pyrinomonadaceae bacterium]|jgi:hypothetical protein|nr:hypothetical protein [Pyrinomonadaceae bacterium]